MNTEIAPIEPSMISVIDRAILNPNIDPEKLNGLLDFQIRMMDKKAEIDFNESMARLQPKLPVIEKKGAITYGGKSQPYAKYEDIDFKIRPLLNEEGFSISFDSVYSEKGTSYLGTLHHKGGHSKTISTPPLPADTSGGKNAIQALGSTVSYAKRYLVGMLLNIITKDEDDDANSIGFINDAQVIEIEKLITDTDSDKVRFLKFFSVNSITEIQASDYAKAISLLRQKSQRK